MKGSSLKLKTFQELKQDLPEIEKDVLLKNHTTFKIGGPAKYFYKAKTEEDLVQAVKAAKKFKLPFFVLGAGSNLLVSDKGYSGMVIKIENYEFRVEEKKNALKIFCGAGVLLSELAFNCLKLGGRGIEWARGVPGTIGGAIFGNAGSFEGSMADIVGSVEALDLKSLKIKKFKNKDCFFGYRQSVFKKRKGLVIVSAILNIQKGDKKGIEKKMEDFLKEKKEKQPLEFPSAGSVFKNPKNFKVDGFNRSAGWLIEQCGLKGKRIGRAEISKKHANFIINLGNARAKDVRRLIFLVKKEVEKKFKVELKEEIRYLGFEEK